MGIIFASQKRAVSGYSFVSIIQVDSFIDDEEIYLSLGAPVAKEEDDVA
jgi:hypothetical protein